MLSGVTTTLSGITTSAFTAADDIAVTTDVQPDRVVEPLYLCEQNAGVGVLRNFVPSCEILWSAGNGGRINRGGNMIHESTLHQNIERLLADPHARDFVKRALLWGYKNMNLEGAEELVEQIFSLLEKNRSKNAEEVFEDIRLNVSSRWKGGSVKSVWSKYYRESEAPFITRLVEPHVEGEKMLEIGTGRGWISYHLARQLPSSAVITQTDVIDYREPEVKEVPNLKFVPVVNDNPLPFSDNSFDTAVVVYVLHHIAQGAPWERFLQELNRVVRRKVIILEDVYPASSVDLKFQHEQSPLIEGFLSLSGPQKIGVLSFLCSLSNRVDGGGKEVPTPCTFYDLETLMSLFRRLFSPAKVTGEFLGIPRSKVYLNTEGLFVVEK